MDFNTIGIVLWTIVGGINFINYCNGVRCSWASFWLTYATLIINLIC